MQTFRERGQDEEIVATLVRRRRRIRVMKKNKWVVVVLKFRTEQNHVTASDVRSEGLRTLPMRYATRCHSRVGLLFFSNYLHACAWGGRVCCCVLSVEMRINTSISNS